MTAHTHDTTRTETEPDIDVYTRAQNAVMTLTERVGYPHRGMSSRLAVAMRDLVTLAKRYGVNEPEARLIPVCIDGLIDDLYHPLTPDAERIARRLESDHDRAEDGVQDLVGIEGESATLLEEHAKRLDQQAASSRTLARCLRAKARQLRNTRTVARARLGLESAS